MSAAAALRRLSPRRLVSVFLAVVLVAIGLGAWLVLRPAQRMVRASADFTRTTGLYVGSTVRILGVPVGKVTRVQPQGTTVRVEFSYPAKYRVPASAKAVIVPPSIVGDRYLQLTPAYTGGPVLADGAHIAAPDTATPIEYDEIMSSLDRLDRALGPGGANRDGSLSRLVDVGAANLRGNGKALHDTVRQLAALLGTLDENKSGLVGVVDHLEQFTTALAKDDGGVRSVNRDLSQVASFLSDERGDLDAALRNLSVALGEVSGFVHDNRDTLTRDVKGLSRISAVLARNQRALTEFVDEAPLALENLKQVYDPALRVLDTRTNIDQANNPGAAVCQLLESVGVACPDPIKHLPIPSTASAGSPPSSLGDMLKVRR